MAGKNININLNSIKDWLASLSKNLSWLFFGLFLLLLIFEVLEIKNSIGIALNVNQPPLFTSSQKTARINFDAYDQAVTRINTSASFNPTQIITQDPFSVSPPNSP